MSDSIDILGKVYRQNKLLTTFRPFGSKRIVKPIWHGGISHNPIDLANHAIPKPNREYSSD